MEKIPQDIMDRAIKKFPYPEDMYLSTAPWKEKNIMDDYRNRYIIGALEERALQEKKMERVTKEHMFGYAAFIGSNEWIYYCGEWILDDPKDKKEEDMSMSEEEMYNEYLIWLEKCKKHQTQ